MKIKEPFSVFSNIAFLFPLYFSIVEKSYIHATIIFIVFVCSTFFHTIKPIGAIWWNDTKNLNKVQKIALWKDTIAANCLIFFNFFIFWQKGFPLEFWYALGIFIFGLGFFLLFKKGKYDFSQGIWHIVGAITTLLAV